VRPFPQQISLLLNHSDPPRESGCPPADGVREVGPRNVLRQEDPKPHRIRDVTGWGAAPPVTSRSGQPRCCAPVRRER